MLWFYTRDKETLRAETRFDNDTGEYVLVLHWPDGRAEAERFPDTETFQVRLDSLKQELQTARWNQQGPPLLLPDGWPTDPDGREDIIH